jgi:hypothetical protein
MPLICSTELFIFCPEVLKNFIKACEITAEGYSPISRTSNIAGF